MRRSNGLRVHCTPEKAWEYQLQRESFDAAVNTWSTLPASEEVSNVYERLMLFENAIAPSGDYAIGCAKDNDDLLVLNGLSAVLLTAEHATEHRRKKKILRPAKSKKADFGTGGLAIVAAEDTYSSAIIPLGKQTGDANYTPMHPVKDTMTTIIEQPHIKTHLALHLLDKGRAAFPREKRGNSIMLGIGSDPSEATLALKDFLEETASDLDLKIGVNKPHINFDKDHKLRVNDDGTVRTVTFAAANPNTTRAHSQALAETLCIGEEFASVQIEINETLLVSQTDNPEHLCDVSRELGAYLGYLFVKGAVESVAKL